MSERITVSELPVVNEDRDAELFEVLRDESARLMNEHLESTRSWFPHEFIPYDMGRTYSAEQPWVETDEFPPAITSALIINTLTEDNLPEYFHAIVTLAEESGTSAGEPHPLVPWSRLWKAEEDRHGRVMGEWLHVTRAVNPKDLQLNKDVFLTKGETPHPKTVSEMLAYTALQELATFVSHKNTGAAIAKEVGDEIRGIPHMGRRMLGRVAGDERHHHSFYAGLAHKAMHDDPDTMTIALARQLIGFEMPGVSIPGYMRHAANIARSGIYGLREFRHNVLQPTMERIGYDDVRPETLSKKAQLARLAIGRYVENIDGRLAKRR